MFYYVISGKSKVKHFMTKSSNKKYYFIELEKKFV